MAMETTDRIHPDHYGFPNGLEVIEIARYLNFNRGNIVKYVARAGRKEEEGIDSLVKELEDLKKAKFYLEDEIYRIQNLLEQ